jgi:hypothetical protein
LYDENESKIFIQKERINELSNILEYISFQKKRFSKIKNKNDKVIDDLNLILQDYQFQKSKKSRKLYKSESQLRKKENMDSINSEICLLGNTPIGFKVLCARYSREQISLTQREITRENRNSKSNKCGIFKGFS